MKFLQFTRITALVMCLVACSYLWGQAIEGPWEFTLEGLYEPAVISDSVFISALHVPTGASVTYLLDGKMVSRQRETPYWLGGVTQGVPLGFSTRNLRPGRHILTATAQDRDHRNGHTHPLTFTVVPSHNAQFSVQLAPYPNQLLESRRSPSSVLGRTTTPGAIMPIEEIAVREAVLRMYVNEGIDPSFDAEHFRSDQLLDMAPKNWAMSPQNVVRSSADLVFSPDAPFYHPIPADGPRVELPGGYIQNLQINTVEQGDGIGYGIVLSQPGDVKSQIISEWPGNPKTHAAYEFPMPGNWFVHIPWQQKGDRHVIFVDLASRKFVSSYKVSRSTEGSVNAHYASAPVSLNSLGDRGGSTSAGFAEIPLLIRPGEAINRSAPIQHALGGPVHRTWLARVFPASSWDYGLESAVDSCTGRGFANTGLVPFGGVIQLDPKLDLNKMDLSLPAYRILEAIQKYGFYVMDYGCADMDIYTSIAERELDSFGGLWGYNRRGIGVQNEVSKVLQAAHLYVVSPRVKKL